MCKLNSAKLDKFKLHRGCLTSFAGSSGYGLVHTCRRNITVLSSVKPQYYVASPACKCLGVCNQDFCLSEVYCIDITNDVTVLCGTAGSWFAGSKKVLGTTMVPAPKLSQLSNTPTFLYRMLYGCR